MYLSGLLSINTDYVVDAEVHVLTGCNVMAYLLFFFFFFAFFKIKFIFLMFYEYNDLVQYMETFHAPRLLTFFYAQLSTKLQLLINTKIPTNKEVSCFKSLRCCIYHAYEC